jgi:hypothetical protein
MDQTTKFEDIVYSSVYDLIDFTIIIITEMEEDDDRLAHKRKQWGETFHFCPVALKDRGVLWPGSQETALRLVL